MDRVAVFVDAGYLFAQGSKELCGTTLTRKNIVLDHRASISALKTFAERTSGLPLLRIYWYDGTSQGPTPQHITLGDQANIKVRLGFVNSMGQQKGVDSLIVTDMLTLARNRAMAECVLLSGDEDLRVGVQQAQEFGVRVHLIGIKPAKGSQSLFLLQEADSTYEWTADDLRAFLRCTPTPDAPATEIRNELEIQTLEADGSTEALPFSQRLQAIAQQIANQIPDIEIHSLGRGLKLSLSRVRASESALPRGLQRTGSSGPACHIAWRLAGTP